MCGYGKLKTANGDTVIPLYVLEVIAKFKIGYSFCAGTCMTKTCSKLNMANDSNLNTIVVVPTFKAYIFFYINNSNMNLIQSYISQYHSGNENI